MGLLGFLCLSEITVSIQRSGLITSDIFEVQSEPVSLCPLTGSDSRKTLFSHLPRTPDPAKASNHGDHGQR